MAMNAFGTLECVGPIGLLSRERDGLTEGLPAATTTCIALQKNRVEIRKNDL